jgi:hypothetical protein
MWDILSWVERFKVQRSGLKNPQTARMDGRGLLWAVSCPW